MDVRTDLRLVEIRQRTRLQAIGCETFHCLCRSALLQHDTSNPTAAESANRTAIAIADQRGARRYVLLASPPLAKLYRSTGRAMTPTPCWKGLCTDARNARDRRRAGASIAVKQTSTDGQTNGWSPPEAVELFRSD